MTDERYTEYIPLRETAQVALALRRIAQAQGSDVSALIRAAVRQTYGAHPLFAPVVSSTGSIRHAETPASEAA